MKIAHIGRWVNSFINGKNMINILAFYISLDHWNVKINSVFGIYLVYIFMEKCLITIYVSQFSHSLSRVQLFATPLTTVHQGSLSITNSQSLPKLMSIESAMPSNHLILCCPLLLLPSVFPNIRVFSSKLALQIRWPNIGVSASTSVLPWTLRTILL